MRQQEKLFIISSLYKALQVYCGNTQCFHHSSDERHIQPNWNNEDVSVSIPLMAVAQYLWAVSTRACWNYVKHIGATGCLMKRQLQPSNQTPSDEFNKCFTNTNFVIVHIGSIYFSSPNNILCNSRQPALTQLRIYLSHCFVVLY